MSAPVYDSLTLDLHARVLAARRRMDEAARNRTVKPPAYRAFAPAAFGAPVDVKPAPALEPALAPVLPEPVRSRIEALRERAARIIAEHKAQDAWSGADLLIVVAAEAKISVEAIKSSRRSLDVCQPRQVFFWIAREFSSLSLPQMAKLAGGRDHTTALHAVRKVEAVAKRIGVAPEDTPAAWAKHLLDAPWRSIGEAKAPSGRVPHQIPGAAG